MADTKLSNADAPQPGGAPLVTHDELARHTSRDNLWVLVGDTVYDITGLLDTHPGGTGPLLKWAGRDATYVLYDLHTLPTPSGTLLHDLCSRITMLIRVRMQEGLCANTSARDARNATA